jgi:shikimate kinase
MRAIVLMGFMGTGKSEVGRRLARRLGRAFVDTDALVAERAGKPVPAIFADDGEAAFRVLEREAIAGLGERPGAVIAVGGGAVLAAENVRRLREIGVLVHLTARPETVLERVGDVADRPVLAGGARAAGGDARAAIARLLEARRPAYEAAADLTVDTSDRSVDEVVEEIRRLVAGREPDERWK